MTGSDQPTQPDRRDGQIITFYSYKGGTGRTMAMANVAWILASNGFRVLAVDWDLESPGLHRYYQPFLLDKQLRSSRGVIDMVREFADALLRPPGDGEDMSWIASYADVLRYAVSLDWHFSATHDDTTGSGGTHQGYLDLLPAGRQDASYSRAVSTFDWQNFYERLGGNAFLLNLADSMRVNYDYVLVDSRTGVSDGAGICTVRLPDIVVASFMLNDQSIDGAAAVAHSIERQRMDAPIRVLPVPMRVEDAEQVKLEAGRDHARRKFASILSAMSSDDLDRYWGDIEIPYKPYYAYEEILATFGDRPRQEGSLLTAYERLARTITDGQISGMPPLEERVRRRWLRAFERRRTSTTTDVFISYASVDRMWAEWISGELSKTDLRVIMREIDFPTISTDVVETPSGDDARYLAILLSQDYVQSPNATELWKQTVDDDLPAGGRLLVPIRLDNVRLPAPFVERIPLDLVGLNEDRAAEVLADAFDRPRPSASQPRSADTDGTRDVRRFPTTEPPVWRAPQRNVRFTGRRALLEEIRNRLSAAATTASPQALYGLGGVGKSQIASEYAHRFKAEYDIVWWASAQQPSVARSSLSELAEQLGAARGDSVSELVQAALEALRTGSPYRRWLLIFDNADEPEDLRELMPQGPGDVLITTRNQAWASDANIIEVPEFSRVESVALLTGRAQHLSSGDADAIAHRLGDLPLAVEQAGAWLATTGQPASQYLQRLREDLSKVVTEELPAEYQRTGAQPWLVSLQSLRDRNPAAAKLLEVCAFFAPEPIPVSILYSDRFVTVLLPYDPAVRDPLLMGRAIRDIGRYALARIDTGRTRGSGRRASDRADERAQTSIQIHPLVQAVIRASLTPDEFIENRGHVHAILAAVNPKDPDQPNYWALYSDIWPHLLPSRALNSDQPEVRQLMLDTARYLWTRVDYRTCEELAEQAIERWQERHSDEDSYIQLMRFHLANALRLQARYQAAYDIDRSIYEILRRTLGEDHEYTIITAGSLAADLRALGNFGEARDLDARTDELAREVFGDDHPRALIASHNLALSLRLVGDLRGALKLNEATLARRRAAVGDAHPYSLFSAGQYGRDLRDTGDLHRSRRVLEAAVEAHRQVLGEDHPETLRAVKNFAVTLRKLGEYDRSYALNGETLTRSLRRHGPDHPDVQAIAMSLACDESAMAMDEAALLRGHPVYEWYLEAMGEDHLFTLAYGNNVAIFLRNTGELDAALELTKSVVERFSVSVGSDHPYTLAANINLGNCLFSRRDVTEARASDEESYERTRRILGPEHPDTLAVANNLATSLEITGDRRGARSLRDAVLPIYWRVLGENHPSTIALVEANRLNCDLEPPPT